MRSQKIGNGGSVRRLTSLLSRRSADLRPGAADRRSEEAADRAAHPSVKRCLNEGGHKLDR